MSLRDEDVTSPAWLQSQLGKDEARTVGSAALESMAGAGGQSGEMNRIVIAFTDGSTTTVVLKRTKPQGGPASKSLGLYRESHFFNKYATLGGGGGAEKLLSPILPNVMHASSDDEQGTKTILMDDLAAGYCQAGLFFGPGSVLNWGKDLEALTDGFDTAGAFNVDALTRAAFTAGARLHAAYWQDGKALDPEAHPWLRAADWQNGSGRKAWEGSQAYAAGSWAKAKANMASGELSQFDPLVTACVDASHSQAAGEGGWGRFQAELASRPYTLVHGDFHPANMMVKRGQPGIEMIVLDWEMVGSGSGPQDLGQFVISHVEPSVRASIERACVESYYAELCGLNPSVAETMTLEQCVAEYIAGGVGRWMWLLPLLATMMPSKAVMYFHDQVKAFMETHGVTPESIQMPRA
jgi:hypothetical protein